MQQFYSGKVRQSWSRDESLVAVNIVSSSYHHCVYVKHFFCYCFLYLFTFLKIKDRADKRDVLSKTDSYFKTNSRITHKLKCKQFAVIYTKSTRKEHIFSPFGICPTTCFKERVEERERAASARGHVTWRRLRVGPGPPRVVTPAINRIRGWRPTGFVRMCTGLGLYVHRALGNPPPSVRLADPTRRHASEDERGSRCRAGSGVRMQGKRRAYPDDNKHGGGGGLRSPARDAPQVKQSSLVIMSSHTSLIVYDNMEDVVGEEWGCGGG